MLTNKVDFMMTIEVKNANPNGDPLGGNMPRTDSAGFGVMSDVSIKRKIRNRMQELGHEIFVKSRDRTDDNFKSLQERYENVFSSSNSDEEVEKKSNELWLDVRTFGQVMTYQKKSIGIRGPVSISMAKSLQPINISTMQITRSTNGMKPKNDSGRSADTMGTKHFVEHGIYLINGSANVYFSERTGFDNDDLEVVKEALLTLFENDFSSARPEGSMIVRELFWFTHSNKLGNVSSAKIQDLFKWSSTGYENNLYEDYHIHLDEEKLEEYKGKGLNIEIIKGL